MGPGARSCPEMWRRPPGSPSSKSCPDLHPAIVEFPQIAGVKISKGHLKHVRALDPLLHLRPEEGTPNELGSTSMSAFRQYALDTRYSPGKSVRGNRAPIAWQRSVQMRKELLEEQRWKDYQHTRYAQTVNYATASPHNGLGNGQQLVQSESVSATAIKAS